MPLGWAAGITAVAGLAGSAIQAGAAGSAASEQAGAAENAQQIAENEFNTITQQESPFMQGGYGAESQLNYLLGNGAPGSTTSNAGGYGSLLQPFTAQYMQQYSPAYQFQLQQGQQGVLNQDAASQGALSGSALKDLIGYNQNYANTAYNNAFNQYQTQQGNAYSRLSGIAQLGQNAASNTGQQGTALAGSAAQSATNIGTALAGGTVGAANAISGGLSSAAAPWLYANSQPANYGTISGGFGQNPSGDAAAGDYAAWSDRRLKVNVDRIGMLPSGLPLYRFRYLWDLAREFVGVMADEVLALFPEAVSESYGYLKVDYRRIA